VCNFGNNVSCRFSISYPPLLPHGLKGTVIGYDAKIGKNAIIYQHVTISQGHVVIGDNCRIGAGAVILPGIKIGNNVKIGANAIVTQDLPDGCTCVLQKSRIILKNEDS